MSIGFGSRMYRKILRVFRDCQAWLTKRHYRAIGQIQVAHSAKIEPKASIVLTKDYGKEWLVRIGEGSTIKNYAYLGSRGGFIDIGSGCSVNPFCMFLGYGGIKVGNNVRIAAHTSLVAFNHNFSSSGIPISEQGNNYRGITIEDDVWIGAGVRVLDGVTIGTGSVVGAGSVVNKSLPPFSIAVGVPARVIKTRH